MSNANYKPKPISNENKAGEGTKNNNKKNNNKNNAGFWSNFFDFCEGYPMRRIFALILLIPIAGSLMTGFIFSAIFSFVLWYWFARSKCRPFNYFFLPLIILAVIFFLGLGVLATMTY